MDIPYGVIVDLVRYGYVSFPYNRYDYEINLDVTEDGQRIVLLILIIRHGFR